MLLDEFCWSPFVITQEMHPSVPHLTRMADHCFKVWVNEQVPLLKVFRHHVAHHLPNHFAICRPQNQFTFMIFLICAWMPNFCSRRMIFSRWSAQSWHRWSSAWCRLRTHFGLFIVWVTPCTIPVPRWLATTWFVPRTMAQSDFLSPPKSCILYMICILSIHYEDTTDTSALCRAVGIGTTGVFILAI